MVAVLKGWCYTGDLVLVSVAGRSDNLATAICRLALARGRPRSWAMHSLHLCHCGSCQLASWSCLLGHLVLLLLSGGCQWDTLCGRPSVPPKAPPVSFIGILECGQREAAAHFQLEPQLSRPIHEPGVSSFLLCQVVMRGAPAFICP